MAKKKPKKRTGKLTEKQRRFCIEYNVDFNGAAACVRSGYSVQHGDSNASKLLKIPHVKAFVKKLQIEGAKKINVTKERWLAEVAKIAFFDIKDLVKGYGVDGVTFKPLNQIDGATIGEINEKINSVGTVSIQIKMHSKIQALDMLKDHLGISQKVDFNSSITHNLAEVLETAWKTRQLKPKSKPDQSPAS